MFLVEIFFKGMFIDYFNEKISFEETISYLNKIVKRFM